MRNVVIFFYLFLVVNTVYSQDVYTKMTYPSVAGVRLGDLYDDVIKVLDDRFGKYNKSTESSEEVYYNVEVGGIYYKYASFYFIHKNGEKLLNQVSLYTNYSINEFNKAKEQRDYIASVYRKKYSDMEERKDNNGIKFYVCFLNRFKEKYNIIIDLIKGKSNGDKTFYYVSTNYGPLYTESTDDI